VRVKHLDKILFVDSDTYVDIAYCKGMVVALDNNMVEVLALEVLEVLELENAYD
jgi:hypothetical protein